MDSLTMKERRFKLDMIRYKTVNNLYTEDLLSLEDAVEKVGISRVTYYNICKRLGKPRITKDDENKIKLKDNNIMMGGGNVDEDNNDNNDNNNNIKSKKKLKIKSHANNISNVEKHKAQLENIRLMREKLGNLKY